MLRADRFGVLLTSADGKLIECQNPCGIPAHILCITEGFQHPWCIVCSTTSASLEVADVDTGLYSKGWNVFSYQGNSFTLTGGWTASHYPYPEISRMRFVVFGIDTGMKQYPCGEKAEIATVQIRDGKVFVNGIYAGIYEELKK